MVKYAGRYYHLHNVYIIKEAIMRKLRILLLLFLSFFLISGCSQMESVSRETTNETIQISDIPEYSDQPYVERDLNTF